MKTKLSFLVFLSGMALSAAAHSRQDDWSLNNRFTAYGDFLYIKRASLRNKVVVLGGKHDSNGNGLLGDSNIAPLTPSLNGKSLGTKRALERFDFEPGYRVGLFFHMNCENSFEASYSHVGEWEGNSRIVGDNNLFTPFKIVYLDSDYTNAYKAREAYTSKYDSGELSWWHHFTPRRVNYFSMSSILGLRYLQVDESFQLAMWRDANKSTYDISTENHLYGGQIGGVFQWNPTCNFSFELWGKLGGFYNDLNQRTRALDYNNTEVLARYTREGSIGAFLGEAALTMSYQIGCYFNIHIGYQFTYLTGLALASDQFTVKNDPKLAHPLSKDGDVILHGAFAGINIGF